MSEATDYTFKLLLLGDSGVGKSSLLLRYADDSFSTEDNVTLGVDFKMKFTNVEGKSIKLIIWDTAGQEKFRSITSSLFRGAQGILLVYDVTDAESFKSVKMWYDSIDRYCIQKPVVVFVGNKSDLLATKSRGVTIEKAKEFAKEKDLEYFETSAKDDIGIKETYESLTKTIMARKVASPSSSSGSVGLNSKPQGGGSKCCS